MPALPEDWAIALERAGAMPCWRSRPDVWAPPMPATVSLLSEIMLMRALKLSHLEGCDVASRLQEMDGRGLTLKQIAIDLGCSASYAWDLRKRYVGLKPANALDRSSVALRIAQGETVSEIVNSLRVSPTWVRGVASEYDVALPSPKRREPTARRLGELSEYVRQHFSYRPQTGEIVRAGSVVGSQRGGRIRVAVRGRRFMAHRLAWFLAYGEDPDGLIDHVDGNPLNNRLVNLRLADQSQNSFNRRRSSRNSTGIKGVSKTASGRFRVAVAAYGTSVVRETRDLKHAERIRRDLADKMHGEFARHD